MSEINNNNPTLENQNIVSRTQTVFAKLFLDVLKIKVFSGQNLWHCTLLYMYVEAYALTSSKPESSTPTKQVEDLMELQAWI